MQPQLTILPLSNARRDEVAELILPIQQTEFHVPITLADQPDLADLEAAYFRPGGHFWGAFVDGELAGTIGLLVPVPAGDSRGVIHPPIGVIRKMFVKPPFRGKQWGVAQRLLETLVTYSRENGLEHLYLGTITSMKAAHRFYERNGFVRVEKTALPTIFPLMPVDDVFYHLEIRSYNSSLAQP
ncbi:GNAT family N-acetyltransferase [Puia dinghuensis]|uniref:N-acetyltransferase n=1 Tax=Puia dinghuensis TaxID=1792502 RepID=A0A8J2UII1_9BACT|nr:GNAT family N-acetyltransferase [Puia dinghuensis]GGB22302.1 N-acetyltransferase [Puia dinghuensis]